jgi:phage gp36-like protein
MPYATEQDLVDLHGATLIDRLADTDGDGVRDAAKIARALETASDMIDGYISGRYALPLAKPSGVLRDCCVSIAVYRMASNPGLLADDMRERFKDAVKFLEHVAAGKANLGGIPTASAAAAGTAAGVAAASPTASPQAVVLTANPRLFGRDQLRRL